jgi:uncharacterized protein YxjI
MGRVLYQMRQKMLCFGDDYAIRDRDGREVYFVDGRAWSIGDKLSFQDMTGNELAFIRQRLLSIGKTYDIERGGHVTTIRKELFTFFSCRFTVDVPGPDDLEARGDFLDMEYEFVDTAGQTAAVISKRWFALADTYGVEVAEGWDDVLILCAAVVIDLCCHGDRRR